MPTVPRTTASSGATRSRISRPPSVHSSMIRTGSCSAVSFLEPRPVQQRDRLVVADGGHVERFLEQRRLVPEVEVDGLHGDSRARRDLVESRCAVSLVEKQLGRRRDDPPPGQPGLLGPAGFVLDSIAHSLDTTPVSH